MTTKELHERAKAIAEALYGGPPHCSQQTSYQALTCLMREAERDKEHLLKHGEARGYSGYDSARMCLACRAYWYASLLSHSLERLIALEVNLKSKEGAK